LTSTDWENFTKPFFASPGIFQRENHPMRLPDPFETFSERKLDGKN
jgi:hypothetical protein